MQEGARKKYARTDAKIMRVYAKGQKRKNVFRPKAIITHIESISSEEGVFKKPRTKKEKTRTFPFGFARVFNAEIWFFAKNSLQNIIFLPLP